MDGVQISVTNFSKKTWSRNNWHVGAGRSDKKNWADELSQSPSKILRAHSGATQASLSSVHFSFLVKDALWMILGYGSDEGSFAVKGQQLFHLIGIGAQCEWSYWDNKWINNTTDTDSHTWNFTTCKVVATPVLTNTSAMINVMISNK